MENWRDIMGFPNYQVSDLGRIKRKAYSFKGPVPRGKGERTIHLKERFYSLIQSKSGHLHVGLVLNKRQIQKMVHRLVLETFVGPCPEGMQCCHYDGDPTNNHLENLRWDTPKANMADRSRHGRHGPGSMSPVAKLDEQKVLIIRRLLAGGARSMNSIGVEYGVDVATIRDIRIGKTWRHV